MRAQAHITLPVASLPGLLDILRAFLGLDGVTTTQDARADALGIPRGAYRELERGDRQADDDDAAAIRDFLARVDCANLGDCYGAVQASDLPVDGDDAALVPVAP